MTEVKLSNEDKKILKAAATCGQEMLTAKLLASKSGVHEAKICKKLMDPEFRSMFTEVVQSSLTMETPAILHTFAQKGKAGEFKHGKLILEITGMHEEKSKVELEGKVQFSESPFKDDEERRAFLEATLKSEL